MGYLLLTVVIATVMHCVAGQTLCASDKACNGHGTCQNADTCTASCKCDSGYDGVFCEQAYFCTNSGGECGAHGNCTGNVRCTCFDKYRGTHCEIPPCTSRGNECGLHGECITCYPESPYCQCFDGWGGDKCEKAPYCTEGGNQCKNGGVCDMSQRPYRCECPFDFEDLGPTCGAGQMTYLLTSLLSLLLSYRFQH